MKIEHKFGHVFTFSTGRSFTPNGGIVGLSPDLEAYEGYDSGLRVDDDGLESDLTPVERAELADYMIALWQRFRDAS